MATYAGSYAGTTSTRGGVDRCDPEVLATMSHNSRSDNVFEADTRLLLQLPWQPKNFTDPKAHNPRKYQYMICAADFRTTTPERLAARVGTKSILSLSAINQNRHATFEMAGAIVEMPSEAPIAAKNQDVYVENYLQSVLTEGQFTDYTKKLYETIGLPSPTKILKDTERGEYNEVVVDGRKGVKMTGIFMVTFDGSPLVPKDIEKQLRKYAKKHNLPIVEIPYETPNY